MSQDTTALPTNPVDTTTAPRGSASNSRDGAVKGGRVSSNWNGDQGKLLFDEALSLVMDMELSDNPKAWEILTQNLSQKHGVTRSVSANKDHMKEMISLMKGIKSEYSVIAAAALESDDPDMVRKHPREPPLRAPSEDEEESDNMQAFKINYEYYSSAMYDWCVLQEKVRQKDLLRVPSWWSKSTMIVTSWYVWKSLNKRQIGAQKTVVAKSKFQQETEAKAREAKRKQEERESAEREDRESKKQVSRCMIESSSTLKEMKEGFLKMTEYLCTPLNRENTPPNQIQPNNAVDDRLSSLENNVYGLKADVDTLKENTAQVLQGQAELRDLITFLAQKR